MVLSFYEPNEPVHTQRIRELPQSHFGSRRNTNINSLVIRSLIINKPKLKANLKWKILSFHHSLVHVLQPALLPSDLLATITPASHIQDGLWPSSHSLNTSVSGLPGTFLAWNTFSQALDVATLPQHPGFFHRPYPPILSPWVPSLRSVSPHS